MGSWNILGVVTGNKSIYTEYMTLPGNKLMLGCGVIMVAMVIVFLVSFAWLFSIKFLTNVPITGNSVWVEGISELGLLASKFSARYFYSYEKDGGLYARLGYRDGTGKPRWVDAFLGGRMGSDEYLLPSVSIGSESTKRDTKYVSKPVKYTKGSKLPSPGAPIL